MKMARIPGTRPRPAVHPASSSDQNVACAARASDTDRSRSPSANAAAMTSTLPAAIRNAGCIPSTWPSIRKDDGPDAHLKRDGSARERTVARRHEIGHERLKGRALHVDPGVQYDHRARQPGDAEPRRCGHQRHAGRGQHQPGEDDGQSAPPAGAGAV